MTKQSIKEIETILFHNSEKVSDELIKRLNADDRKGVQQLLKRWERQRQQNKDQEQLFLMMSEHEQKLRKGNVRLIAGVDEVGRGPLAGPVVAAAVVLPEDFFLLGINDSKKLTKQKREEFYDYISRHAIRVGVGIVSADEIDRINIYEATKQAMMIAIKELKLDVDHLLIDAMKLPLSTSQTLLIKGDQKSVSIAASSIIAKVTRDRIMTDLGREYPEYGFEEHMGYGTSKHLQAMKQYGVTVEHRKSFAPVKAQLLNTEQLELF